MLVRASSRIQSLAGRQRPQQSAIWLVLIGYLLLASLYSVTTPLFEASDEQWHYPAVKYIADHGFTLPIQNPANPGEWRQEGGQPPLYYMLGAALTFWIDTSDLDQVRQVNPHADIGVVVPDGNANMMVHDPARESFPWHGAALAVHLLRLFSIVLSAITVLMTYLLALELFPGLPGVALAAAALTAFNPMFLFISASVNNDNLSNALASVLLLQIVRLVRRADPPPLRDLIGIGLVAGAGMLAKFNIGFLLPLVALALLLLAWRQRSIRSLLVGGVVTGVLTIVIAGWWYVRNWQLYGDPTGLNVFLQIVGSRPIPADLRQLWSERHTFLMSYWGFFGGVNVPLPDIFYTIFNALAALGAIGIGAWLISSSRDRTKPKDLSLTIARLCTAIWIVVLFISLLRWTSVTWASQGRLMFTAIAPLSAWLAIGLWQIGQFRWIAPLIRWRILAYSVGWFVAAAALSALVIRQAYFNPVFNNPTMAQTAQIYHGTNGDSAYFCEPTDTDNRSNNCILVAAYDSLSPDNAGGIFERSQAVGQYVEFNTWMGIEQRSVEAFFPTFHHNWSVFVHLVNAQGVIVAQRDVYPMQGLWAAASQGVHLVHYTDPNGSGSQYIQDWLNYFAIQIPDYTYAPQTLNVWLGFYDSQTGQRLVIPTSPVWLDNGLVDPYTATVEDNQIFLGTVDVLPRKSDLNVPNPMAADFADEMELIGYSVSDLAPLPGEQETVTLYWRTHHKLTTDYRVFVHILDPQTTTIFGQDDAMPAHWTRPTTTWQPDEIVADAHTFTIRPGAPPGQWQIEVGAYSVDSGGQIQRLRVFTPDGGDADNKVYLSRVRIDSFAPDAYF